MLQPTWPRYELPAEVIIVDALPRTPSAKVDLLAVRELVQQPRRAEEALHGGVRVPIDPTSWRVGPPRPRHAPTGSPACHWPDA